MGELAVFLLHIVSTSVLGIDASPNFVLQFLENSAIHTSDMLEWVPFWVATSNSSVSIVVHDILFECHRGFVLVGFLRLPHCCTVVTHRRFGLCLGRGC